MNKDVIYVEPEDDITDIILKIENSKEKIVALVPPKKAGVFRSVVNIKLIAKSGVSSGKKVVFVTVDPSIVRLAAAAKLPVTKNLQTAPVIPELDEEPETMKAETLVEESDGEVETEEDVKELIDGDEKDEKAEEDEKEKEAEKKEQDEDGDDEDEEDDKKDDTKKDKDKKSAKSDKKDKKPEKSGNRFVEWFKTHKTLAIIGGVCGVLLIVFLVWAFAIAPAATVSLAIKTEKRDPSEVVSFTDKISEENADEGKFYIEEKKIEDVKEVEFEATGKKNVGETASGDVVVYAYFKDKGAIQVSKGSNFTNNGLTFVSSEGTTLSWDGEDSDVCDNKNKASQLIKSGCQISGRVKVSAAESGSKYNIAATSAGWDTTAPVGVYSDKAMSGGTDAEITTVQQSDVDKAKDSLTSANEDENKEKLMSSIGDDKIAIASSFKQSTGEAISTPGVGEEVKDGTKPKLKAVTTASIYVVDKAKLEEFLTKKAELGENQKIYELNDLFIENFTSSNGSFSGRLKANYQVGPKITTSSIVDMIKGKGFGDAQHTLKDYGGVTDVHIKGSFPWVNSIPNDTNKITIEITAKDDKGSDINLDAGDDDKSSKSDEKKSEKDSTKESEKKE